MTDQSTPSPTQSGGQPPVQPPPQGSRPNQPGLLMILIIGAAVVCLSCSIVGLAGLAGYNDGVRELDTIAENTRQADINRQYDLALTDVAGGNRELAALRLEHVVLTLNAPIVEAQALLTQVNAVTATPTATLTPTPTSTPPNTATPTITPTPGLALPEPATIFANAQASFTTRDYETVIDQLTVLRGLDVTYQEAEVEQMLHDSLVALSRRYLTEPSGERLAEGILLAE